MSDWEGDEFEEVGGGETDPVPLPIEGISPIEEPMVEEEVPEERVVEEQPLEDGSLEEPLAEESHPADKRDDQPIAEEQSSEKPADEKIAEEEPTYEQPVEEPPVCVAPPASPSQHKQSVKQPVRARTSSFDEPTVYAPPSPPAASPPPKQPIVARPVKEPTVDEPQSPPASLPLQKQPVRARSVVEEPANKEPVVEEPVVESPSPQRIVSAEGPEQSMVEDGVSESSYVLAASIATPRTPSVEVPTQDEKSLLERLDAICTLLNQPVGGGMQMGGMADLSGHAIRNVPMPHSPLTALDAQQRFTTPRLHYAHQLDCFYHHVFLEAPGPNMAGLGDHHLRRLYDDKRANIPLLLSEFLGSEENLFRLLMLKYNRPSYARFVHFND